MASPGLERGLGLADQDCVRVRALLPAALVATALFSGAAPASAVSPAFPASPAQAVLRRPPSSVQLGPSDPAALLPGARRQVAALRYALEQARYAASAASAAAADDTARVQLLESEAAGTSTELGTASSAALSARSAAASAAVLAYVSSGSLQPDVSPAGLTPPPGAGPFRPAREGTGAGGQTATDVTATSEDAMLGLRVALRHTELAWARYERLVATYRDQLSQLRAAIPQLRSAASALSLRAAAGADAQRRYSAQLSRAESRLHLLALVAPDPSTGIPPVVKSAYVAAQSYLASSDPSCHLSWADLAAIGQLESGQAQWDGTRLAPNGDTYPVILGPPLDGSGGTAVLASPGGSLFDGGGPYERAIGPMQLLPATWLSVAPMLPPGMARDPSNVFSAATAAGIYLCRAAGPQGLQSPSGLQRAYQSYNHSRSYVLGAMSLARHFGAVGAVSAPG